MTKSGSKNKDKNYLFMESCVAGEVGEGKSSEIPVDTGLGSEEISKSVPVCDGGGAEMLKLKYSFFFIIRKFLVLLVNICQS